MMEPSTQLLEITDEMIEQLINEQKLGERLKEAENKQKKLSKEEWYALRVRAKKDLFFLCYGVLGYDRLSENLHGNFCTAIRESEHYRFRLFLMPRGHFKTTIKVIAHSIQEALPYDAEWDSHDDSYVPSWPAILGPDIRILIAHETDKGAGRHLFQISTQILTNTTLMMLFPEIVPTPRLHTITKSELQLPRNKIYSEPTFDTMGVGAKSQGRHYDKLNLDDIYGDKARDSEAEDATTKDWIDGLQGFYTRYNASKVDFDGTRYKYKDAYGHIMSRYGVVGKDEGGRLYVYKRSIEEYDPETKKLKPIFHEEIDPKDIEVVRKNKKIWVQYSNDPVEGDEGFDSGLLRYFYWKGLSEIITFSGVKDQIDVQTQSVSSVWHLDRCILIDPGVSRTGGFVVTGTDWRERIFCLEAIGLSEKPDALVERIFIAVNRWKPRVVAIESDFFAVTFKPWLESEMRNRHVYFEVYPVHTKKLAKDARIAGLGPYLANQLIWVNEKQEEFIKQWDQWGKSTETHILDAMAYGPEVWRKPLPPDKQKALEDIEEQLDDRDIQTGYSKP